MQNDVGWAALWAVVGAAVAGLFSWLGQKSKSETDHEVAVLAEWSKLNQSLADRLSDVERDCAQMRKDHAAEIEKIRRDHATEMDDIRKKHRVEMRLLRESNEGLQRMIAQNSQSAAQLLSDSPVTTPKDDE